MKRTRAQQPKTSEQPQDPASAADAGNPKPQRRAKQPRQPKGAKKSTTTAAARAEAAAIPVATTSVAPTASPAPETAPTVPDVSGAAEAGALAVVDWDLDGGGGGGAWWTWGVDEDKLLGWLPYGEEDFRCLGDRAADAEVAFDDDIWRIHQIYEIPSYAAK